MKQFTQLILCLGLAAFCSAAGVPQCPEPIGEQAYLHPDHCDQFFLCTNGTLTLETCENGLLFDGKGAVHNHCNYNWAVDCGNRKFVTDQTPISTPGCEYLFGVYPDSNTCSTTYNKCAYGEPHPEHCEPGLVYDHHIHGCQWPDQMLENCNPEAVIGFKCPSSVPSNSINHRFLPYPRYAVPGDCHRLITCVDGHPRLITCGDGKVFNEESLTCEDPEDAPYACRH